MVDRKDVASWLEGPNAQRPDADTDYPGRRLGMPQHGPGSVGRFGRRLVAIIIDWTLCQLIAYAWLGVRLGEGSSGSWWPLVIFGVENLLLGASAAGLASFWSSCPKGANDVVADLCGFEAGTTVVALIYGL